jgi:hypothetical protein
MPVFGIGSMSAACAAFHRAVLWLLALANDLLTIQRIMGSWRDE